MNMLSYQLVCTAMTSITCRFPSISAYLRHRALISALTACYLLYCPWRFDICITNLILLVILFKMMLLLHSVSHLVEGANANKTT